MWVTGVKSTEGYINNLYQQRAIFTKTCERKRPDTVTSSYKKKNMHVFFLLTFFFISCLCDVITFLDLPLPVSLWCTPHFFKFHCDVLLTLPVPLKRVSWFCIMIYSWFFFPIVIVRCFLFLPVSMTLRLRVQCRRFILPLNHKVEVWVLDRYKNHSGVMSV